MEDEKNSPKIAGKRRYQWQGAARNHFVREEDRTVAYLENQPGELQETCFSNRKEITLAQEVPQKRDISEGRNILCNMVLGHYENSKARYTLFENMPNRGQNYFFVK